MINYTGTFKIIQDIVDWINNFVPGGSAPEYLLAEDYSETATYNNGDYAVYEGDLYICTSYVQASTWDPSKWEKTTVPEQLRLKPGKITSPINNQSEVFNNTQYNVATGYASHAEGSNNTAMGDCIHVEGSSNSAYGNYSHVEGSSNTAGVSGSSQYSYGYCSHAEGNNCRAYGSYCHAEGYGTVAGDSSTQKYGCHSEGYSTNATGNYSHAEGNYTRAQGDYSHAEGYSTKAYGNYCHVENAYNEIEANCDYNHAEGNQNGIRSYSGLSSNGSHAEGYNNYIYGCRASHAEGESNYLYGSYSHAEGRTNYTHAPMSHVGGMYSNAGSWGRTDAVAAFAHGIQVSAKNKAEVAFGSYNNSTDERADISLYNENASYAENDKVKYDGVIYTANAEIASPAGPFDVSLWTATSDTYSDNPTIFSIGNGTAYNNLSNVFEIRKDGTGYFNNTERIITNSTIPDPPTTDGTYTLQCTVTNGVATCAWV